MSFRHQPQHPAGIWVVVADRACARIFSASQRDCRDLAEVETLLHPESGAHSRDVYSDRPGRFPGRSGECCSGDNETDFRRQTAHAFAAELATHLDRARVQNQFGELVLMAPPLFLGILREHVPDALRKLVVAEVDKELVSEAAPDIAARVWEALETAAAVAE